MPILFAIIYVAVYNTTLQFYVTDIHTGTDVKVCDVYEQTKGDFSTTATYNTYPKTQWTTSLGQLTLTPNAGATYYGISTALLKNLVQEWVNGTKTNQGFALVGSFGYFDYYWDISVSTYPVRLIIDYTPANEAPVAANVSVSGTAELGMNLTGQYTYSDANSDPEGSSIYKWYRADNAGGTNAVQIQGANAIAYVLQDADYTKYVKFQVTPVASSGTSPGTAVSSAYIGPVAGVLYKYPSSTGPGDNMKVDGDIKIGGKILLPPSNAGGDLIRVYSQFNDGKAREELVIDAPGGLNVFTDGSYGINLSEGEIIAKKFKIGEWVLETPDYVFDKGYHLRSLEEVNRFISKEKHLPGIPSAVQMKKDGVDIAELNMAMLKKIEELMLYSIRQQEQLKAQNVKIETQQKEIDILKEKVK